MSFRLLTTRLYKHGRLLVQNYLKRDIHVSNVWTGPTESTKVNKINETLRHDLRINDFRNNSFLRFGNQARRLFIDNVLNRVTNPYSVDLRLQATKKLLYGDSTPFFALVGVSLASGDGVLTKNDELEAVCWEIRHAMSNFQQKVGEKDIESRLDEEFGIENLNIGKPIAKGCSAVVYAASLKESTVSDNDDMNCNDIHHSKSSSNGKAPNEAWTGDEPELSGQRSDGISPLLLPERTASEAFHQMMNESNAQTRTNNNRKVRFNSETRIRTMSENSASNHETIGHYQPDSIEQDYTIEEYPLALKMMFNYDIQSNAMAILKAMYRETVPAKRRTVDNAWEKSLMEKTNFVPPHPNIVEMYGVFCDQVPDLSMSATLYPMALPQRLNPQGYGRNMSLFLLMKRYNINLKDYLRQPGVDMRTRILLFAQLLEAVAHLNRHGVSHRDIKSDNILIELRPNMPPTLVLTDFGCCIADKRHGLRIPYTSDEIDKGGNVALMAPEIIEQLPGTFAMLNYTKADLWACGAIAYEIFGSNNPFYSDVNSALKNTTYEEDMLPAMDQNVPRLIQCLVQNILQRNPSKRLSPDIAANVVQLFLWSPSSWLRDRYVPSSNEILQWLLSLTTKILCEGPLRVTPDGTMGRRTYTEYLLIASFLTRVRLERIKRALDWIHNVNAGCS
ncbi:serine/threonine-protein kinase pink-1, mitochondrial [Anopheles arabiensis]|uniref:non-specific serine/threonine protein kinase n=2 Tax=gambiae species complex TaxID=44542 RepID=A0A6E8VIP6_ANOCL|nr:serine/threonine-protein kinase pink-1, mitochondrial [Anopheles arabiensis]XP_040222136.2 serine/threonine-protein kinase Pink1, mitochondrial [Anopheles coluzzii]